MSRTIMKGYVQCRLRRSHVNGTGYSELVTYLPTHGSNAKAVAPGRTVILTEDIDPRPWSITAASDHVIDATCLRRKHKENRSLSDMLR